MKYWRIINPNQIVIIKNGNTILVGQANFCTNWQEKITYANHQRIFCWCFPQTLQGEVSLQWACTAMKEIYNVLSYCWIRILPYLVIWKMNHKHNKNVTPYPPHPQPTLPFITPIYYYLIKWKMREKKQLIVGITITTNAYLWDILYFTINAVIINSNFNVTLNINWRAVSKLHFVRSKQYEENSF